MIDGSQQTSTVLHCLNLWFFVETAHQRSQTAEGFSCSSLVLLCNLCFGIGIYETLEGVLGIEALNVGGIRKGVVCILVLYYNIFPDSSQCKLTSKFLTAYLA